MPTLSVRLPYDTSLRFDEVVKSTHRSRSYLVNEALDRHVDTILHAQNGGRKSRLDMLRALKGAEAKHHGARSADVIDADIREFRGKGRSPKQPV
jgi:predicted transcriptional regulator